MTQLELEEEQNNELNNAPTFREYTTEEKREWYKNKLRTAIKNHTAPFTRKVTSAEIFECKDYIKVALYHKTSDATRFKAATTEYKGRRYLNMPLFCLCLQSHGIITYVQGMDWLEVILSQISPISFKQKLTAFCRYGDYGDAVPILKTLLPY